MCILTGRKELRLSPLETLSDYYLLLLAILLTFFLTLATFSRTTKQFAFCSCFLILLGSIRGAGTDVTDSNFSSSGVLYVIHFHLSVRAHTAPTGKPIPSPDPIAALLYLPALQAAKLGNDSELHYPSRFQRPVSHPPAFFFH